jgi:hypothetical protein
MAAGTNPNGIGSGWVKALWITKKPVGEMAAKYDPTEYEAIHSTYQDNPLDNCPDVIDSIPKLMRDEKNIEDAQKEGNELFLDVCESFRYGVMSYASEQATPREV